MTTSVARMTRHHVIKPARDLMRVKHFPLRPKMNLDIAGKQTGIHWLKLRGYGITRGGINTGKLLKALLTKGIPKGLKLRSEDPSVVDDLNHGTAFRAIIARLAPLPEVEDGQSGAMFTDPDPFRELPASLIKAL